MLFFFQTAEALTDCRPIVGVPSYLYHINMVLSCPLPEEQNTRGRRIYPPEESAIGFGIITLKEIPKVMNETQTVQRVQGVRAPGCTGAPGKGEMKKIENKIEKK